MKPKPLPSAEQLRDLFIYDQETGAIFPKTGRTSRRAGVRCDKVNATGYRVIYCAPLRYYAHRIAWKLHYGMEPEYIDHINGNRTDNSIANLREATHAQNLYNMPRYSSNTSGYKGVYKRGIKWGAQINVDRRRIYLGTFASRADAIRAVQSARATLHGEFANH
jgi:hypothetical protein